MGCLTICSKPQEQVSVFCERQMKGSMRHRIDFKKLLRQRLAGMCCHDYKLSETALCLYCLIYFISCCVPDVSGHQALGSDMQTPANNSVRWGLKTEQPCYIAVSVALLCSLSAMDGWMNICRSVCLFDRGRADTQS